MSILSTDMEAAATRKLPGGQIRAEFPQNHEAIEVPCTGRVVDQGPLGPLRNEGIHIEGGLAHEEVREVFSLVFHDGFQEELRVEEIREE